MNKSFGFYIDRAFYIINKMPAKRALEVVGKKHNVVINKRSTRKSQLWKFDNTSKTIQSVGFKNFALQIAGEGRSRNVNAYLTNSRWF
jgi:septal ring-binding cell division protein DamX